MRDYPNAPQRLADGRAAQLDLVIIRKSTEGLFCSAAVHDRAAIEGTADTPDAISDIMCITRHTTHRLHEFTFAYKMRHKARGHAGRLTCVNKANVFRSQVFFRQIFDDVKAGHPEIEACYS